MSPLANCMREARAASESHMLHVLQKPRHHLADNTTSTLAACYLMLINAPWQGSGVVPFSGTIGLWTRLPCNPAYLPSSFSHCRLNCSDKIICLVVMKWAETDS